MELEYGMTLFPLDPLTMPRFLTIVTRGKKIEDNTTGFHPVESFVDNRPKVHYFILGDDAFSLRMWLMKPFSLRSMDLNERVFNYWISRWRTVV